MRIRQQGAVGILLCLSACGGGSGGGTSTPRPAPSQVSITAGNQQTAQVATVLPVNLAVKVTDSSGAAMSGIAVAWAVTSGGGSLANATAMTDSNGAATAQWKLGTATGANAATATVSGVAPATFSATGAAGPAATLLLSNPSNPLTAGVNVPIAVTVLDQYGNQVSGSPAPSWSATPGAVVTVTTSGTVTGVAAGAGFVTATLGTLSTTLPVVVAGTPAITVGAEEVVYLYSTSNCATWDVPDSPAHAVRLADGTLTLIAGTAPANYASFGADFSSLKHSCAAVLNSVVSPDANTFANEEWIYAIYRVGGTINALIHNEFHDPVATDCKPGDPTSANPCAYISISYASSSDSGHTYTQAASPGQLVAPPATTWNPGPPAPPVYGYLNPTNIVLNSADGYYYSMFISVPQQGSGAVSGMCVMRTQTLTDPTSWRAWDGSGFNLQMLNPYVGPAPNWCTPVIPNSEFIGSLTYNTHLAAFVVVWDNAGPAGCGTLLQTSTDLVHWSNATWLRAHYAPVWVSPLCAPPNGVPGYVYASLIDHGDSTINFEQGGQTPYLYYTRLNGGGPNRDLVRVPITFQ
jgi:hypothetical protein